MDIIIIIIGIVFLIYGNNLNTSLENQLESLLSSGSTNPGNIWMILGGIVVGVGLIVLYKRRIANSN